MTYILQTVDNLQESEKWLYIINFREDKGEVGVVKF